MAENSLESIAKYLESSLSPQHAKDAERQLKSLENEPGFSITLLHVIASSNLNISIRLAAALFFKNLMKRKWADEEGNYLLSIDDVNHIKSEILNIMMGLPTQLQVQVGEAICIIAESDFPHNWQNLIDELVSRLSPDDFVLNKAILMVAHSIFKRWRPLFRSDELFLEIKLVLDKFAEPFLAMLKKVDELMTEAQKKQDKASLIIYAENLLLLVQIYYDLNCQDIPEFFEDHIVEGMEIMYKYLSFESPLLTDPDSDDEIDVLIKVKTSIVELVSLYITRYSDVFEPLIETFITVIWKLINDYITKQQKFDLLVVKVLSFLTTVTKMAQYQHLFNNESSLREMIEKIILPNICFREVDEEQFEDEPINYVRSDLEGSDFDSRRKSATDFLRELKDVNTGMLTNIVLEYVKTFLENKDDWRNKDMAVYLFSSLAAKGTITNVGVTSTNVLVDVVQFFADNIANDLTITGPSENPILKTDAIKYILIFRNQLTKEQLLTTFPLLITNLQHPNIVVHTYAAITIERLLSMNNLSDSNHAPVFNKEDMRPFTHDLLDGLFGLILQSSHLSPEKIAENEFLMKTVMRVLNSAEDLINDDFRFSMMGQLIKILSIIAKNPSNPKFSHYVFESLGLLIRFGSHEPQNIQKYIELVVPSLLGILSEDVQEFVPYTFQILAYLLELYPNNEDLPDSYRELIKPLLSPSIWEFRGNIPGVTRLLIAILEHAPGVFTSNEQSLTPLLGVFQKLIASKINDIHGFDLLQSIVLRIPLQILEPYLKQIAILLLTRLKNSRTDKFLKKFVIFICSLCCIPLNLELSNKTSSQVNADFAVSFLDLVQPHVFGQIYTSFILPTSGKLSNLLDKKIVNLGILQLVISDSFVSGKYSVLLVASIDQLANNLANFTGIVKGNTALSGSTSLSAGAISAPISELDLEAAAFGSQFSKIVSIQGEPFDPVPQIKGNDEISIKAIVLESVKKVGSQGLLNNLSKETEAKLANIDM